MPAGAPAILDGIAFPVGGMLGCMSGLVCLLTPELFAAGAALLVVPSVALLLALGTYSSSGCSGSCLLGLLLEKLEVLTVAAATAATAAGAAGSGSKWLGIPGCVDAGCPGRFKVQGLPTMYQAGLITCAGGRTFGGARETSREGQGWGGGALSLIHS